MRPIGETLKKPLFFLFTIILCIGILFPIALPAKTAKAAQQTADFGGLGYSNDQKITPIGTSIDGFVFCGQTSGADVGMRYSTNLGQGGSEGVFVDYDNGSVSEISIKRDDSSSFKLTSIWLDAGGYGSYEVKIEGYLGDSLVTGCSELNVDITSAVTVSLNWTYSIDEIRITATSQDNGSYDVATTIDNIVYEDVSNTPSITSTESNPTNSSSFSVTITFDEDVSGFTLGDLMLGNGSATNFTNAVANRQWTVDLTPLAEGTVTVDVPSGVCIDAMGNGNDAATQFSINYDGTSPSVLISTSEADPTNNAPFSVTFTFDENVSGFTQGDITVGNGSASNFVNTLANRVWTADIIPSGDGTVTVDVNAGVCADGAGNCNDAAAQFSIDYDGTSPSATISSAEGDPTNSSLFSVTVTFDENISGFVVGDITVGNGSASNFTNTVANRVWTADITPSGDGTVTVDVNNNVCTDAAGNGNDAAVQFSINYDGSSPTAAITTTESDPTNSSPIPITITFNEDVSGFVLGDITVGNGNSSNFVNTVANREWTADITPSGEGAVTVDINAGVCVDAAGNGNDAASQLSIDYDTTAPTVTIASPESDPTNSSPFTVTVTFDEDISGFVIGDITVGNGSVSNFVNTVANRAWTADITPNGDGEVTVDVNAGVCADGAGNCNDAAAQFSVDYDATAPTVAVNTGLTMNEGYTKTITTTQLSATDTIADDASIIYTVTDLPDNGGLYNNGSTLALNGTFTQQDIIDGKILYAHNDSETTSDSFVFKVSDNVNELTGQTFSITVIAVNDNPNIMGLPEDIAATEDVASNVDISAAMISDSDSGSGSISLTLTVSEGTLTASTGGGVTVSGSGTSAITLTGTHLNIDTYLNTVSNIKYTGALNVCGDNAATLVLTVNDGGNTGTGDGTDVNLGAVNIDIAAVNDPPVVTVNTGLSLIEGETAAITITQLSASDVDTDADSVTFTLISNPLYGQLENTDNPGVSIVGFTQKNLEDGKIQYVHDGSDTTSDSFAFKVVDNQGGEQVGQTFSITVIPVNDEPSLSAIGLNPTFTEGGAAVKLFSGTSASTVEAGQTITDLTLTVTNVTDGSDECLIIDGASVVLANGNSLTTATNSLSCTVSVSGNTATVMISGTLSSAETQSLVDTMVYSNYSDTPTSSNRDVTITSIQDSGGTANGGDDTAVLSVTSTVTMVAVNDKPTIIGLPTDIGVYEDTASSVNLSIVTISDDSGENSITLTITASAGTLSASSGGGVTVAGSGTSAITLSGTVESIDTYLNTVSNIKYTGPANAYGDNVATLTLTANDGGNTGIGGGTDIDFGSVNMDITEVNDAPFVDVNTGLSLNEGAIAAITSTKLSATDVDTSVIWLSFTVTDGPANGRLENSDNPGVSITGFTQQNLIDGKIYYVHDGSNITSDGFTFKVNDGEGGVLTGQTFNITVNAVDDDAPTVVKNEGLTLNRGVAKTITTTELLATDTDSADSLLIYTVMAEPANGRLENLDHPGVSISIFTQQNLVDGKILYVHDDSNTTSDSFAFNVSDNNANVLSEQTFSITITSAPVQTITPSPTQTPGEDTRTISGTLLDEEGNPKVGYVVELHSTPITAITDSQGRYSFDNVDYTAHTLFVKTPAGQQITSFDLAFEVGDEFSKTVTTDGADIKYTNSTVSVDITIALDGDEDSAEITELSGVDNPATGRTLSLLVWAAMAVFAVCSIGWVVFRRIKARV